MLFLLFLCFSRLGGVIPPIAEELHKENIVAVVDDAVRQAGIQFSNLDCIGVTNEPGLAFCLRVGLQHAKMLAVKHALPLIPVHHMEAHALTPLIIDSDLKFPYLVLLLSGGHALVAVARDIDDFILLGTGLDSSPGEVFDKVRLTCTELAQHDHVQIARQLRLRFIEDGQLAHLSGGAAIETVARKGDHKKFNFACPRASQLDCDFSFGGIYVAAKRIIETLPVDENGNVDFDTAADICASLQFAVVKHIARRVICALEFIRNEPSVLGPKNENLGGIVLSGGVGANGAIQNALRKIVEDQNNLLFSVPPPHLCTDNGVMIAWNALLLFGAGKRIVRSNFDQLHYKPSSPIGVDCRALVRQFRPSRGKLHLDKLYEQIS